jgi:hypothetical protein
MKNIIQNVKNLLETDKRCRNDDKWLIFRYIREVDGVNLRIPFTQFHQMTPFETITRARRRIQNDLGQFQAEPGVKFKRMKQEREIKQAMLLDWGR